MLVGLVGEEVVDAFVFQQALNEVEVRLSVLHAVAPIDVHVGIRHREILDQGDFALLEDLVDDGHGVLGRRAAFGVEPSIAGVVEDPAVLRVGKPGEGGRQDHGIPSVFQGRPHLGKVGDDAVEVPVLGLQIETRAAVEANRERLAQEIGDRNGGILGQDGQIVAIGNPQGLATLKSFEE